MADNVTAVKTGVRLSDYISKLTGVHLKALGNGRYRTACPLHGGDNDSGFSIDDKSGLWHCFTNSETCGGGSVIDFWMKLKGNDDFGEAIRSIANDNSIKLEEQSFSYRPNKKRVIEAMEAVAQAAYDYLVDNDKASEAYEYALERGISDEIIDDYQVGYIPEGREAVNFVLSASDDKEALIEGGVLTENDRGVWCGINGRLIFPIRNSYGDCIGFGGRLVGEVKEGQQKYKNSPETPIYHKSEVLYGMDQVTKRTKHLVVVEGYLDLIAFNMALGDNDKVRAVATCGTALSDKHAQWMHKMETVTVVFDGDVAGQKAAVRSLKLVNQLKERVNGVILAEGKDPWDVYMDGDEEYLSELHKDSLPLLSIVTSVNYGILEEDDAKLEDWLYDTLPTLEYRSHRDQLISSVAEVIGKSVTSVRNDVSKSVRYHNNHDANSDYEISPVILQICGYLMSLDEDTLNGIIAPLMKWDEDAENVLRDWFPVVTEQDLQALYRTMRGVEYEAPQSVERALSEYLEEDSNPSVLSFLKGTSKKMLTTTLYDNAFSPSEIRNLRKVSDVVAMRSYHPLAFAYLIDMACELHRREHKESQD